MGWHMKGVWYALWQGKEAVCTAFLLMPCEDAAHTRFQVTARGRKESNVVNRRQLNLFAGLKRWQSLVRARFTSEGITKVTAPAC